MTGRVKRRAGLAAAAALAERHAPPSACALCGRPLGARVEWHHLVPKSEGGRITAPVHPICHRTIHATLTNAELARDHVRLAKPRRLLLLGDAAAKVLTGQPLGSARGRVHRIEGVRAVATFHPRWLLQRPSDKALAWKDLLLLMSEEG